MKQAVTTNKAPGTPSLLSQGIIANGFLFTAGFIHTTADGKLIEGSTEEKFRQIMKNLEEVLAAAGTDFDQAVKVIVYVTDIAELPVLNEVYKTYFTEPMPAREGICVKALPLGASIEVSMVALLPQDNNSTL